MSPRDRPPVRTPSPRQPSGQDLGNQMSPPIWLCSSWNWTAVSSGQRRNAPPTEPGFSQGFFSVLSPMEFWFLAAVASGLLSWGHLISSNIVDLIEQKLLNWTELDDAITEFNNEMPLTENWVLNLVILHYWHYFPILILCSCFVTICIVKSAI